MVNYRYEVIDTMITELIRTLFSFLKYNNHLFSRYVRITHSKLYVRHRNGIDYSASETILKLEYCTQCTLNVNKYTHT